MLGRENTVSPSGAAGGSGGGHMGRATCALSAIIIGTKLFGFGEKLVVAHFFGTSEKADVYFAVTAILLSVTFLIKELVYPTMLPIFSHSLEGNRPAGSSLFGKVFLAVAGVGMVVVVEVGVFAGSIGRGLVPGFSDGQHDMVADMLRLLMPALLFGALSVVTYTTLNARRRFLISATGELGLKGLVVVGLVCLVPILGLRALPAVLGVGALACLLFHLVFIPERGAILNPTNQDGGRFRKVLVLMAPLAVGVVFSHISGVIDNLLASTLPSGSLSCLNYAKKIVDAVLLIGPVAIVTVVYSQTSHLAGAGRRQELERLVARALRVLLYLGIPATCLILALREDFLRVLFQHGRFDVQSTLGTSQALAVYAAGLVTFSLESLLVYTFFALSDTKTPVVLGIVCVFLDIALALAFLQPFGHVGIAAALVISKTVKVGLLLWKLRQRIAGLLGGDVLWFLLKVAAATLVLGMTLAAFSHGAIGVDSTLGVLMWRLLGPFLAGVAAFLLASYVLGITECRMVVKMVTDKLRGGKGITRP